MAQCTFDKERHIKYWQRCYKSLLPNEYTSTDSSRMSLAFFILAALDLLGVGPDTFPERERNELRDWILRCQHPHGGFCGSPNHRFPEGYYGSRRDVDPANLAATYFALLNLAMVGGLEKVNRTKCSRWLKRVQREDGSFGELVQDDGSIHGGRDMRYCQCATAIRWILKGGKNIEESAEGDIDVDKLVQYIANAQTYDGGIAETSDQEAHAGYTFCAIAALASVNKLSTISKSTNTNATTPGLMNTTATISWLLSRQVSFDEDDESENMEESSRPDENTYLADLSLDGSNSVGCSGRCNKNADTCYCWWVGGSLKILGQENLFNANAVTRFLLAKTQHRIGGFGKAPEYPPDIYHSYMGLAILAQIGKHDLKALDSVLCISTDTRERIPAVMELVSVPIRHYWEGGSLWMVKGNDPDFEEKLAKSEGPPDWVAQVTEDMSLDKDSG